MTTIPGQSGLPPAFDREQLDQLAEQSAQLGQLNKRAINMDWLAETIIIAFTCYKGGVGKTTFACMLAVFLAALGHRVLVVDLNKQGNSAEDLGLEQTGEDEYGNPIFADGGAALAQAIMAGKPVTPVPVPGRENLFICPGGHKLKELLRHIFAVGENAAPTVLARSLAPVAKDYDYILIDVPPENEELTEVAAATSQYLWIPLRTDDSSLRGFNTVAGIFRRMKAEYNPYLEVLGAAIFATTFQEGSGNVDEVLKFLADRLDGVGAVYPHIVPYVEGVAKIGRRLGMTVTELEELYIAQDRNKKELDPVTRLSRACIRMAMFMTAELDARRAGHPAGAVVRVDMEMGTDEYGKKFVKSYTPVYRTEVEAAEQVTAG